MGLPLPTSAPGVGSPLCASVLALIGLTPRPHLRRDSAAQVLHASNCLHRDLKPQNMLCAADGTVKLIDFGLSCHHPVRPLPCEYSEHAP
jgi:serine/threonine protein kinase